MVQGIPGLYIQPIQHTARTNKFKAREACLQRRRNVVPEDEAHQIRLHDDGQWA